MICEIICIDGFLSMLHLDIVHMLSAYVHVMRILSKHMCIMHTLFAVVLDIFLPNRQCRCHPYVIYSTLYISFHVQLSFCTLSAQMHIVVNSRYAWQMGFCCFTCFSGLQSSLGITNGNKSHNKPLELV